MAGTIRNEPTAPGLHGTELDAAAYGDKTLQAGAVNRLTYVEGQPFVVVFTNGGENDEFNVKVSVRLRPENGDAITLSQSVPEIAQGERATVRLALDQAAADRPSGDDRGRRRQGAGREDARLPRQQSGELPGAVRERLAAQTRREADRDEQRGGGRRAAAPGERAERDRPRVPVPASAAAPATAPTTKHAAMSAAQSQACGGRSRAPVGSRAGAAFAPTITRATRTAPRRRARRRAYCIHV